MNRGSQRILILGGFAVAVIIIALLAVIVLLLMGGDDDGSSEAARVTATATGSPTARATPRATATSTVASSTPAGQQAAAVTTTAQQTPPPGAPQQTAEPSGQQPSSTAPPSAPSATTTPGDTCPGPPAVAAFTANPATITAGQSSTLDWGAVSNATSVTVDQGIGAVQAPGARVVSPGTTTIYTLTVTGCGGTIERQATVIVNPPTPSPTPTPTPAPPPGGGSWGITPIDLAVTGLHPDNLPQGEVWVTIVNNGPYGLTNAQVTLGCSGTAYLAGGGGSVAIATMPWAISVSLDVGWSAQYDTTISVDTNQFSSYFLECSIEAVSFKDDITNNNSGSAWIP